MIFSFVRLIINFDIIISLDAIFYFKKVFLFLSADFLFLAMPTSSRAQFHLFVHIRYLSVVALFIDITNYPIHIYGHRVHGAWWLSVSPLYTLSNDRNSKKVLITKQYWRNSDLVAWDYGISTFVGYLTPHPFLCKLSVLFKKSV